MINLVRACITIQVSKVYNHRIEVVFIIESGGKLTIGGLGTWRFGAAVVLI
jgi:hypothetical protein